MQEQFVPYKLAVKLKELGFEADCLGTWELMPTGSDSSDIVLNLELVCSNEIMVLCKAPLWQQAFDWFRIEYGYDSWISKSFSCYNFNITKYNEEEDINEDVSESMYLNDYTFHKCAREACLEKLMTLLFKTEI